MTVCNLGLEPISIWPADDFQGSWRCEYLDAARELVDTLGAHMGGMGFPFQPDAYEALVEALDPQLRYSFTAVEGPNIMFRGACVFPVEEGYVP